MALVSIYDTAAIRLQRVRPGFVLPLCAFAPYSPDLIWLADRTTFDARHMPPADLPAGQYRLIVGL